MRRLEVRRPVPSGEMSVSQLTTVELQQELKRRIVALKAKRDEHLEQAREIERELESLGVAAASAGASPDGKPRKFSARQANSVPLVEVLRTALDGNALTTREAAEAALAAGYKTNSQNFVNSVGVALHRYDEFQKKDGKWSLVK